MTPASFYSLWVTPHCLWLQATCSSVLLSWFTDPLRNICPLHQHPQPHPYSPAQHLAGRDDSIVISWGSSLSSGSWGVNGLLGGFILTNGVVNQTHLEALCGTPQPGSHSWLSVSDNRLKVIVRGPASHRAKRGSFSLSQGYTLQQRMNVVDRYC